MGSRPSKSVPEATIPGSSTDRGGLGSVSVRSEEGNVKSNSISPPPPEDVNEYIQVGMDMTALNKYEDFGSKDSIDNLNNIVKIYYMASRKKPEELERICDVMIEKGVLDLFVRIWDQCHENPDEFYSDPESVLFNNLNRFKVILWNFSDKCPKLAAACYRKGAVIERIMKEFSLPNLAVPTLKHPRLRHMIKANLGILHNLVRHANYNRNHIRKDDGVNKILAYQQSTYLIIKAKVFIVLAYCITEEENSKITTGAGVIGFIVKLLKSALESENHVAKSYAFSAEETVAALNKLASNDDNKKAIVDAEVLPLLTAMMDTESFSDEEHLEAVTCVWSLAFHQDNKEKIINEPKLLDRVKELRNREGAGTRLLKAIESLMFVLELEQPATDSIKHNGTKKHVMLSYNWEVQHVMLKLRDYLKAQGINIWMDVDKIHDSILSAMAEAVEDSALIIVAMTESYKNSNSCRTEAEYAYQREVPILPLLLQNGYKADGWLGAMIGTKLYVNLSSTENFAQKFPDVYREVESRMTPTALPIKSSSPVTVTEKLVQPISRPPVSAGLTVTDGPTKTPLELTIFPCQSWTTQQVEEWLVSIGVEGNSGFKDCDGVIVAQLCKLLVRSPETYFRILRDDLRFNFKDMLRLTSSIESFFT